MTLLRALLLVMLVSLLAYTGVVISREGTDFVSAFSRDIARMTWAGQFNVDFLCLLVLAALWVAWRHRFSAVGIVLAVLVLIGGTIFLSIYLLVESARSGGDALALVLGPRRGDR